MSFKMTFIDKNLETFLETFFSPGKFLVSKASWILWCFVFSLWLHHHRSGSLVFTAVS